MVLLALRLAGIAALALLALQCTTLDDSNEQGLLPQARRRSQCARRCPTGAPGQPTRLALTPWRRHATPLAA